MYTDKEIVTPKRSIETLSACQLLNKRSRNKLRDVEMSVRNTSRCKQSRLKPVKKDNCVE